MKDLKKIVSTNLEGGALKPADNLVDLSKLHEPLASIS